MEKYQVVSYSGGDWDVLYTVLFDGKDVTFEGGTPRCFLEECHAGMAGRKMVKYYPKDGQEFLYALCFKYGSPKNSYMDVIVTKDVPERKPGDEW